MGRFGSGKKRKIDGSRGGGRDGGRGRASFGGRRSGFGGSDRPEMFDAVCDKCGDNCKVPFQPKRGKPIFCSDCFESEGGGSRSSDRSGRRSFDDRGGRRDSGDDKVMRKMDFIENKLDRILELLERN